MLFKQTDEHADLVFKLRSLLDKANEINLQNTVKLIKSSRALQIIQSRLAYKQQLYTEALLKSNSVNNLNMPESVSGYELLSNKLEAPSGSNYLSEDDNESLLEQSDQLEVELNKIKNGEKRLFLFCSSKDYLRFSNLR